MVDVSIVDGISMATGVISIILSIIAIWFALRAEKDSRNNYDRTKEVLSSIDEKSAVVETTVTTAQKQLLDTVTKILEETAIPKQESADEKAGMAILQMMIQDPAAFKDLMKTVGPLMQQNPQQPKAKEK